MLLGLFVILYATAQVDEEKFQDYSRAFSQYFQSVKPSVLEGSDGVLEAHKGLLPEPVVTDLTKKTIDEVQAETEAERRQIW